VWFRVQGLGSRVPPCQKVHQRARAQCAKRRHRHRQTGMHTMTQSSTDKNKITKWIHTGSHDEGQVSKQARQNGGDAARKTHCRNHVLGVHAGLGQHLRIDQEQVADAGRGSATGCLSNSGKLTTNWTRAGACAIESVLSLCACTVHTHPSAGACLAARCGAAGAAELRV
jgi:hypothetical protein